MRFKKRPVIGITAGPAEDCAAGRAGLRQEYAQAVLDAGGAPVAFPLFREDLLQKKAVLDFLFLFLPLDGIMIPGGDDIAPSYYGEKERRPMKLVPRQRTDFELSLIKAATDLNLPVLGICYGMQLMNVALGGSLYQDLEAESGSGFSVIKGGGTENKNKNKNKKYVEHRRGMHELIIQGSGPLPAGRHMVNSSHHQGVRRLASALCAAAHSEDGLVEAFYLEGQDFFIGVQWHPERMAGDPLAGGLFGSFIRAAGKRRKEK